MSNDGINAGRLLSDDTFNRAVETVRKLYIDQWRNAQTQEQRERLHIAVNLLDDVVNHLAGKVEGDVIEKDVEKKFKDKQKIFNIY